MYDETRTAKKLLKILPIQANANIWGHEIYFEVGIDANKIEIAGAVEKKFKVRVTNVRTLVMKGKQKSAMTKKGKFSGFRADRKKAIVTLHKEDKLDLIGGNPTE